MSCGFSVCSPGRVALPYLENSVNTCQIVFLSHTTYKVYLIALGSSALNIDRMGRPTTLSAIPHISGVGSEGLVWWLVLRTLSTASMSGLFWCSQCSDQQVRERLGLSTVGVSRMTKVLFLGHLYFPLIFFFGRRFAKTSFYCWKLLSYSPFVVLLWSYVKPPRGLRTNAALYMVIYLYIFRFKV